ncbi:MULTISPECIES: YchE family NAAT transporter [Ferrimonas]|uniref:YchE family NAAT transporter n=1 Tax=Ferrimonas TaxID=44011 RepID=UPI0003FDB161|nr:MULTISPECIES: YchE family NAAT transporter [Ferrimonas]USD36051.1 YchE family NAAT transporter [Ferrimonas sp. SCSIO 43195]
MDFYLLLQFFLGLVAIINPIGLLPVFVSLTSHQSEQERLATAKVANLSVVVILLITLVAGQLILNLFSISIPAFRIAGGVLITFIAMSMLQGKLGEVKHNKEEDREAAAKESVAVVPLALPLMAGPGAISSVIVFASQHRDVQSMIGMAVCILAFGVLSWLVFRTAPVIFRVLGKTGINVITRIMGLLMMSIGIEVIAAGLKTLFPALN